MSILDNNPVPKLTASQQAANSLVSQTRNTFNIMVNAFNNGSNNFWNNPMISPSSIAEALGTNAREVFELHYALGQLIGAVKPESIAKGLSVIREFTINDDGTVTVHDSVPPSVDN